MYKNRNKYQTQATECTEWSNRGDSMATADTPTIPIGEYANIVAAEAAEARVVPASDALDNLRSDSVPSIGREEISKKKKRPSDKKATKKHCNKLSTQELSGAVTTEVEALPHSENNEGIISI